MIDTYSEYMRQPIPKKYRVGALQRCCIAALKDASDHPDQGDTHECHVCHCKMIYRSGAWEWEKHNQFLPNTVRSVE